MAIFVRIDKQNNYFIMPSRIHRHIDLSYKGRGLLGTLLSLPENWDYSIEGLSKLTRKDGKASVASGLRELEELGYLRRRKIRDEHGRVVDTEYIISEAPIAATLTPILEQFVEEDNPIVRSALQRQLFLDEIGAVPRKAVDTAPKRKKRPSKNIEVVLPAEPEAELMQEPAVETVTENTEIATQNTEVVAEPQATPVSEPTRTPQQIEAMVREQIDYNLLMHKFFDKQRRAVIDNMVEVITDVLCRDAMKSTEMLISGAQYSVYHVQQRMQKLEAEHIEEIMFQIACNQKEIKNPYMYLRSMLFNAPASHDMKSMMDSSWMENTMYRKREGLQQ